MPEKAESPKAPTFTDDAVKNAKAQLAQAETAKAALEKQIAELKDFIAKLE